MCSAARLKFRINRYVSQPGKELRNHLSLIFQKEIFYGPGTKRSVGSAWRRTKCLFRSMVGILLRQLPESTELAPVSDRWSCDSTYVEGCHAVVLTNCQVCLFWAAASPKLDQEKRSGKEHDRAVKVSMEDMDITAGMRNYAELFIGTIWGNDDYKSLKQRYVMEDHSGNSGEEEEKGKKIELEDKLFKILDPLTKGDIISEKLLRQVEAVGEEKRGTKRKRN